MMTTKRTIEPKILYFGTPVALITSLNEDGATNLAPISSFWAPGWTMTLGLLDETKTLIYNFRDYFQLADQQLGKTFRAET
jgi:hypothetical protein